MFKIPDGYEIAQSMIDALSSKKTKTCPIDKIWIDCVRPIDTKTPYKEGGWSERDSLPTGDPIGDIDETSFDKVHEETCERLRGARKNSISTSQISRENDTIDPMEQFKIDDKAYMDTLKHAGLKVEVRCRPTNGVKRIDIELEIGPNEVTFLDNDGKCCNNPSNHKKVHLVTSAYKMCAICKSDLGDWVNNEH